MNKTELAHALAAKIGTSKNVAATAIDGLVDVITETLAKGGNVALIGFGTFSVGARKERQGKNPQTGAELVIPAAKVAKFSAGAKLKEAVNSK